MNNKKLFLINCTVVDVAVLPMHKIPYSLAYTASHLMKKGFDVEFFDRTGIIHRKGKSLEECNRMMLSQFEKFKPDYISIESVTPAFTDAIQCADLLKNSKEFKSKICLSGLHPMHEHERSLKQAPAGDFVLRGDGLYAWEKILSGEDISEIPNIVYRDSEGIIRNTASQKIKIDIDISIDYRKLGLDIYWENSSSAYNSIAYLNQKLAYMKTSSGCPGRCNFCVSDTFMNSGFYFSTNFVLEEMSKLTNKFGIGAFAFEDRTFRMGPKNIIEFCRMKIEKKMGHIPWFAMIRPEFISEEVAELLGRSGCILALIGLESASPKQLELMNKGSVINDYENAFSRLNANRVPFCAGFVYGLPGQTEEDLIQNIEFFKKYRFFDSAVQQFVPCPGAPLYEELCKAGKIDPDDTILWNSVSSYSKPIEKFNFSEIPNEKYFEIFNKHANFVYETCCSNRNSIIKEYGLEKYSHHDTIPKIFFRKIKNMLTSGN